MRDLKKKILNKLHEAKFMVKPEDVERVIDKLGKDDVVKLMDEEDENNPWAICTASVGREDKDKYERCVKKVKKQYGVNEELTEEDYNDETHDIPDLKKDVQKFLDKLNLRQFDKVLANIDKPIEKAELIAAFSERIGIPREKLPNIISNIIHTAENINPKMTKNELIETVTNNKKVIKRIKKKNINESESNNKVDLARKFVAFLPDKFPEQVNILSNKTGAIDSAFYQLIGAYEKRFEEETGIYIDPFDYEFNEELEEMIYGRFGEEIEF